MAGDWIKVESCTPHKPEVLRLARELSVTIDDAFGKAMRFWIWLDGVTVDGRVDGVASTDVDAVVGAPGFSVALQAVGWLRVVDDPPGIEIPNFDTHNGETAKSRAMKSRRQKKWRHNVDGRVDGVASTAASTREEKRREEKINTVSPNGDISVEATPTTPTAPAPISFPLASGKLWDLPQRKLDEYQATYADRIDVMAEFRKAKQWLQDNKPRRKSPGGMPAFLTRWLNRACDNQTSNGRSGAPPVDDFEEFIKANLKGSKNDEH